jgi:PAS domain S-box-containing protein
MLTGVQSLIDQNLVGLAMIGADRRVQATNGALCDWLPPPGIDCCESVMLTGMEAEFAELAAGRREPIVLPGVRGASTGVAPISVSVVWDGARGIFVAMTTVDLAARQVEMLLGGERRQRRLIEEQLDAGNAQIRLQEARYRDIVESTDDLVIRTRPDRTLLFVNRRFEEFAGGDEVALLGRDVDHVLRTAPGAATWSIELGGRGASAFEQELIDAAGTRRWIGWNIQRLDHGGDVEWQAIGRDTTVVHQLRAATEAMHAEAKAAAVARERLRLARDLHDTLVHSVLALLAQIRLTRALLTRAPDKVADALQVAEDAATEGVARARAAVADIRQQPAGGEGVVDALERLAAEFHERNGVVPRLVVDPTLRQVDDSHCEPMIRIVEEALRNTARHARATEVGIALQCVRGAEGDAICVMVTDNGVGFDPACARAGHFGLIGMAEQAALAGAEFRIDSRPACGTNVTLLIPVRPASGVEESMRRVQP